MKKLILTLLTIGLVAFSAATASAQAETKEKKKAKKAQASSTAPKTVIHVVTVDFKDDATAEQIKAATDGVHALPAKFSGITRVWTRTIKNQSKKGHIFVMEFASEQALKDYAGSEAQKEWYAVYEGIRKESATSDITN